MKNSYSANNWGKRRLRCKRIEPECILALPPEPGVLERGRSCGLHEKKKKKRKKKRKKNHNKKKIIFFF